VQEGAKFLRAIGRDTRRTVMIESNHDDRLMQWARRDVDRMDTENAEYLSISIQNCPPIGAQICPPKRMILARLRSRQGCVMW
jgi:hypothetical protein